MQKTAAILIIISLFFFTACQKHTIGGAGLGGIGGGVIGSQIGSGTGNIAAIIGGTLVGAALGGYIGSYMDRMDKKQMNQTLETTPDGNTQSWENPETDNRYQVTPEKTYKDEEKDQYCREFQMEAQIGGETEETYGTACRQPDGAWKIQ